MFKGMEGIKVDKYKRSNNNVRPREKSINLSSAIRTDPYQLTTGLAQSR